MNLVPSHVATAVALTLSGAAAFAQQGQTVKVAWIDPLSGLMAPVGQNQLRTFQFFAEKFNTNPALNPAGVKFELVHFDNKLSPAESLSVLKSAIDQGVRYVFQGSGSGVALALTDAINKHNERNPGKEVIYLNYAAVDPDLTNSKCSYWHFRLDADTSMKMEALVTSLQDKKDVKKVFLLNQNYAHGQQVAKYAKDILARKRPDIQVVGDDLHPLAQVRDFAPYIAKIKASGADTVITGNWGSDLALLVKAANDAGLSANFYTYYGYAVGAPTAFGSQAAGRVYQISYNHYGMGGDVAKLMNEFKTKFDSDWFTGAAYHAYSMLSHAMARAKSTEPLKVAAAMEGLKFKSFNGDVEMRKADHQMQQTLYLSVWQKTDAKNPYNVEGTGHTFAGIRTFEPYVSSTPTSCEMKRPSGV